MLPGLSGLEITRMIRARRPSVKVPILFVTAKTEPEDVVRGLEAGADDYVTKPFDNAILLARVHALLRRFEWLDQKDAKPSSLLVVGPLSMNTETYEVSLDSQPMDLTRSEFRLLQALLENQGRVLSRDRLIEQIQGEGVNVVGRTVDTHVFGLRKKLGPFSEMIETIRGVGYRVRYV
jgi:two-component system phosphate regulon response regulator PhoB